MPVSINNTTLTFNNATTQTTAPVNTNANVNSVSAGTGISVSATTGALTVTNSGVTSVSGAGTVSVSASTGGVTITGTGGSGTVTSVATGNGLSGGTITSTGTLTVACPTANSVGSYAQLYTVVDGAATSLTFGTNYATGFNNGQVRAGAAAAVDEGQAGFINSVGLSGTWKWLGSSYSPNNGGRGACAVGCRVS